MWQRSGQKSVGFFRRLYCRLRGRALSEEVLCGLPKTVKVLDHRDFTSGRLSDGNGHHCMIGWVSNQLGSNLTAIFNIDMTQEYDVSLQKHSFLLKELVKAQWEVNAEAIANGEDYERLPCKKIISLRSIARYNDKLLLESNYQKDAKQQHYTHLAKIFNRFTARLGYTKGNPEAREEKR